jgi:fumarate reductase flavoprotein subunit
VGAGDAGLAAAIESIDAGAAVIVFEKMGSVRSTSSAMSMGVFSFAGTDLQQRQGVQDSNDLLFKDIMNAGKWTSYEPLVKVVLTEQLDGYNWLTALGVKWFGLIAMGGNSVPRCHATDPVQHVRILQETAEKKGVKILFRTRVTELLTDQDKRVIGVCAQSEGQALRVKAGKGVVLATGGFGFDTKRMAAIDPRLATIKVVVSRRDDRRDEVLARDRADLQKCPFRRARLCRASLPETRTHRFPGAERRSGIPFRREGRSRNFLWNGRPDCAGR